MTGVGARIGRLPNPPGGSGDIGAHCPYCR